jgi:NADP-dependent 3-hydroxy acid dehydrogenase YdfG
MTHPFRRIVLTGATGGIGRALAGELAGPGVGLLLLGRDADRLAAVAGEAGARGATVSTKVVDSRDGEAMAAAILAYDDAGPVDLVIANAGVSAGRSPGRRPEAAGVSRRLMEVNHGGVLNTVEPLLPRMQARRAGRIAIVSSLAALRPQPDLPSYSATKMAVRGYGVALRGWLKEYGVGVTMIYPGFVTSPMSIRHKGSKPFEISAAEASRIIVRGLARGRPTIAFPRLLALGCVLNMLLPAWASDLTDAPFRADVEPDDGR